MNDWIDLYARDGHCLRAFVARPEEPPIGAVIVIQEVFGVNRHIRWVAEQYAANGFLAIAPCLFDRVGGNVELEYDQAGIDVGRQRVAELGFDAALLDIEACVQYGRQFGQVGAVGFCWGGTLAWLCATRLALPSISYYGARTRPYLDETVRAPLLMHFGRHDPLIPADFYAELAAKQPSVPVFFYEASHGFNCNERADFHAESAALAWRRSLRFLRETLTSDSPAPVSEPDAFALDPRLAADTLPICELPLCSVLLMNDARFPWLILVPRLPGLADLIDLPEAAQQQLMHEIGTGQHALRTLFEPDKLNVAALGNVVAQLHVHVIARFHADAAWPKPVWGTGEAVLYSPGQAKALQKSLREALTHQQPR